ncbi:MAG: beta-N-acetylhexosaminidase, partial [Planctomycetota bacterium]
MCRKNENQKLVILLGGLVIVYGCALVAKSSEKAVTKGPIVLIPKPMKMEVKTGTFSLKADTVIYVEKGSSEIRDIGKYLAEKVKPATGLKLPVRATVKTTPRANSILLTTTIADKTLGEEGYELIVKPDSILVRASYPAGLFYGVQTIRQLLPAQIESSKKVRGVAWMIPCVRIADKPRFGLRGYMLDSSRYFQTKDFIKRYLDLLAYYKLNYFHWHFTDNSGWRLEIKKYPKLTKIGAWRGEGRNLYGGFYSQDDVREILAYAKSRYITVIPEIEMPGHSNAALFSYPHLSCSGGPLEANPESLEFNSQPYFYGKAGRLAFCAGKEETFEFLQDVLLEVIELFDMPFIHVGGDERPQGLWSKCPRCQAKIKELGLKNESQLQNWFMDRI